MSLTSELLRQIDDLGLTPSERAGLRCRLAKELEEAGNYEAAREAMGELWQGVGERPVLESLDARTTVEVLLRAGTLSGWIGSANQIAGAQERAKDLLSESITLFESLSETEKVAEAQTELAYCYWREGAFDEARITLQEALSRLTKSDGDLKAVALLRTAIVERTAKRPHDALRILSEAVPLFDVSSNHTLKGRFYTALATTLENLGAAERRDDYRDRALVEYAAASYHFEQAGHTSYRAAVENNLGFLFFKAGKFDEAYEHLDHARRLFTSLKDKVHSAQVDETRARALLAQGRNFEAEKVVSVAVRTLEKGGEQALLAEALTTHGVALARVGQQEQSRLALERAIEVSEQAGDMEGAGRAALTLIEELKVRLTEDEVREIYCRADELLSGSQHTETIARLRECARHVVTEIRERAAKEATVNFVYASEKTAALLQQARRVATIDRPVLITGETGTGKEVLARLVHDWSGRDGRFVAINCAALTDTLIESQLFGHKKGSFADAVQDYPGAVREAAGGTLLLDEVAELSRPNQVKLLRLIESGEIHSIGATAPEHVNARVIASTNRNLRELVAQGHFRDDLFYRLQTFHLEIPPLRERTEDIPAIAAHFIEEACRHHHKRVTFSPASLEVMRRLPLMGNARELRILIERTLLRAIDGTEISADAVETIALRQTQKAGFANVWEDCSLVEEVLSYERGLIQRALEATQGGVTRAARLLGITHQTLSLILSNRHKDLLGARKPVRTRRRSIIRADVGRVKKK
ncbi:MAG: two-component system, NtrC family, response regulator AtoC [Acidobacteriota bacterium]|nr:two-component system, NtrC family, response regulator AtoC [Acidobacteriota bacterium]